MNRLIKQKQWMDVIRLRTAGLTFAEISRLTGVSRQRAHQIISQAQKYAEAHDNELAKYIAERSQLK